MGNEVKKLKISEAKEVSGGKLTCYKKGTCICEACGKKYKALGLSWHELPPEPVEIEYQYNFCPECIKKKFPTGYDEEIHKGLPKIPNQHND